VTTTEARSGADARSARERLLDTASRLFYGEGVQTVGIDRIIDESGVAKSTLYKAFGSKDALVRAYLQQRHDKTIQRLTDALARTTDPRGKILSVYDVQAETFAEPGFNGCAFITAAAEAAPDSSIDRAATEFRGWIRAMFRDLSLAAGADEPETLARQLHALYDGASLSARMDHDPTVASDARQAATALIDAALAESRPIR
jgi:AcrR family transcriptional regulator